MKLPKSELLILSVVLALGVGPLACGEGQPLVHQSPETSFSSANPGGPEGAGGVSNATAGSSSSTDGGGNTNAGGGSGGGSGGDAGREIEEADIVKVVGNRVYAMSRYGGVSVIDARDPDDLSVLGRFRIEATPFEMYVEDDVVFALYQDYGEYVLDEEDETAEWVQTSNVVVIDATNPRSLTELTRFDVPGNISDSRIVGDVLYVASFENGYCWRCRQDAPRTALLSLDVSDPAKVTQVDELSFDEDLEDSWSWRRSISVTDQRLYVSGPVWRNSDEPSGSTIQVVDISNPSGEMRLGDSVEVAGQVNSRWQMDEYGGVLRVLSQPFEWNLSVPPTLETFTIESSEKLAPLGSLALELPREEQLQSVRFDGERAYAITFEQTDPLFTIDLSDQAQPVQAGLLEMPGWLYHMEPRGDRLLGLGFDQQNEDGSLAVSLFDVSDLGHPTMLSRANFGGDWGWMVEDQDRIHKAFRILEDASLILMPFSGWIDGGVDEESYCYGNWVSGIQLIDWQGDELRTRGIAETRGDARRGLLHEDRLLAVSDERVESFDISDRDAPKSKSHAVLAQYVSRTLGVGDSALRVSQNWYTDEFSLDLVSVGDVEEPGSSANLEVDLGGESCGYSYLYDAFPGEERATFLFETYDPSSTNGWVFRVVTVDTSDPEKPSLGGDATLDLDPSYLFHQYVSDATELMVMVGNALVIDQDDWKYGEDGYQQLASGIQVVDLGNPNKPKTTYVELPAGDGATGILSDGSIVARSHFETNDDDTSRVRFYLDRVDVSDPRDPRVLPSINVPGSVVALSGDRALTVDFRYVTEHDVTMQQCWENHAQVVDFDGPDNATWDQTPGTCTALGQTLTLVEIDGDLARVVGDERIESKYAVSGVALGDEVAFASLSTSYYYYYYGLGDCYDCFYYGNSAAQLVTVGGLSGGAFASGRIDLTRGNEYYYPNQLAASGHRAVLSTGWHGKLSIVDASDASRPELVRESDVYGYVQDLTVIGHTAVASLGFDGVQAIELGD